MFKTINSLFIRDLKDFSRWWMFSLLLNSKLDILLESRTFQSTWWERLGQFWSLLMQRILVDASSLQEWINLPTILTPSPTCGLACSLELMPELSMSLTWFCRLSNLKLHQLQLDSTSSLSWPSELTGLHPELLWEFPTLMLIPSMEDNKVDSNSSSGVLQNSTSLSQPTIGHTTMPTLSDSPMILTLKFIIMDQSYKESKNKESTHGYNNSLPTPLSPELPSTDSLLSMELQL